VRRFKMAISCRVRAIELGPSASLRIAVPARPGRPTRQTRVRPLWYRTTLRLSLRSAGVEPAHACGIGAISGIPSSPVPPTDVTPSSRRSGYVEDRATWKTGLRGRPGYVEDRATWKTGLHARSGQPGPTDHARAT